MLIESVLVAVTVLGEPLVGDAGPAQLSQIMQNLLATPQNTLRPEEVRGSR
jgi:hypothetical protein